MKIELPKKVLFIINNLQLAGYDAFAVGGCVRDSILARKPQDWDITTSAKPEAIKEIFRRTVDTGIEHGTVTVMIGKDSYEVTELTVLMRIAVIRRKSALPIVWKKIFAEEILRSMRWHIMMMSGW